MDDCICAAQGRKDHGPNCLKPDTRECSCGDGVIHPSGIAGCIQELHSYHAPLQVSDAARRYPTRPDIWAEVLRDVLMILDSNQHLSVPRILRTSEILRARAILRDVEGEQ